MAETLVGLATTIAAKLTAYTYAFYVNRLLRSPQGRIKDPWARRSRKRHPIGLGTGLLVRALAPAHTTGYSNP